MRTIEPIVAQRPHTLQPFRVTACSNGQRVHYEALAACPFDAALDALDRCPAGRQVSICVKPLKRGVRHA